MITYKKMNNMRIPFLFLAFATNCLGMEPSFNSPQNIIKSQVKIASFLVAYVNGKLKAQANGTVQFSCYNTTEQFEETIKNANETFLSVFAAIFPVFNARPKEVYCMGGYEFAQLKRAMYAYDMFNGNYDNPSDEIRNNRLNLKLSFKAAKHEDADIPQLAKQINEACQKPLGFTYQLHQYRSRKKAPKFGALIFWFDLLTMKGACRLFFLCRS